MEVQIPIPPIAIPNEIITKILSHLGKNDLLKCRLVNHSWNELSLKILRNPKYQHEHQLTQHNIQKFIEFSKERNEEWILPFYLNLKRGEDENEDLEEELSVKILRNEHYLELTQNDIQKFIEFSNERTEEWVLPFYLNFRLRGDTIEDEESGDYHQIPKYIQKLQTIFGKKCVRSLRLSHGSSLSLEAVKELVFILTLIAPSLIYLDLSEFKLRYEEEEEWMKIEELLGNTQLNFPNLSRLFSCPSPTDLVEDEDGENEIHKFLIEKSQSLTELRVICPSDLLFISKQIGSLRTLKIVNELQDIDFYMEAMKRSPFPPVLKDLSFNYYPTHADESLNVFLSSFSTTLQSLTVTFNGVPPNSFPRLCHLRFLQIHVKSSTQVRVRVDPEKLNLNSETFPVLESMDISTNICFESTTHENSESSKDDRILGTVKHLSIRVLDSPFDTSEMEEILDQEDHNEDEEIISRASAKDYVDHLQELFPNVISLTLVNESDEHEEYLNQLLIEFIQSDGAPKIQNLELQNCKENYFGHILNGLDDPDHQPLVIIKNMNLDEGSLKSMKKILQGFLGGSELKVGNQMETRDGVESRVITFKTPIIDFKITGLEKICMSFNNDFGQSGMDHKSNQKDLFLMSLPKHLPLLTQIDISQRMFGYDQEFCKKQIINVQDTFPDLVINATL